MVWRYVCPKNPDCQSLCCYWKKKSEGGPLQASRLVDLDGFQVSLDVLAHLRVEHVVVGRVTSAEGGSNDLAAQVVRRRDARGGGKENSPRTEAGEEDDQLGEQKTGDRNDEDH